MEIKNFRAAVRKLVELSEHLNRKMYFHPFKYEIEHLMDEFESTDEKIPEEYLKEIFTCIGYLKASRQYRSLEMNDIVG
jgi:hypothetical protein